MYQFIKKAIAFPRIPDFMVSSFAPVKVTKYLFHLFSSSMFIHNPPFSHRNSYPVDTYKSTIFCQKTVQFGIK